LAIKALQSNEKVATDLIASQLALGIKSDGSKSDFIYAPFTIAVKKTKSGLASVVSHLTNFDTGESYAKLYMDVSKSGVEFGTNTDKEESISERMDGKAFKPNKENKEELIRQFAKPTFIKNVKEFIKNG
jgi:hypothetical protein